MKRNRRHHNGFILLLVLLLLPVVAVSTVSVARISLQAATEAQSAQSSLQGKWAQVSCTTAFLPQAGSVLREPDEATSVHDDEMMSDRTGASATGSAVPMAMPGETIPLGDPDASNAQQQPVSVVRTITLGGLVFELTFADEQAKLNVNLLYQELGEMQALAVLESVQSTARDEMAFDLRPYTRTGADGAESRAFASFGQVYRAGTPPLPVDTPDQTTEAPANSDLITCWGSGQLNVRLARPEAIELVAGFTLKPAEIDRLLAAIAKEPEAEDDQDLAGVLDALSLTEKRRARIGELLIDRSACYSLGITHGDGQRTWRWLAVNERDDAASAANTERTGGASAERSRDGVTQPKGMVSGSGGILGDGSGRYSGRQSEDFSRGGKTSGGGDNSESGDGSVYVFAW